MRSKPILLCIISVFSIFAAVMLDVMGPSVILVLIAIYTIAITIGNLRLLIFLILIVSSFFYEPLESALQIPKLVEVFDEVLIFIGFLATLATSKGSNMDIKQLFAPIGFLSVGIVSTFVNQAPFFPALYSLRFIFFGLALYYIAFMNVKSTSDIRKILRYVFIVIITHIIIVLAQGLFSLLTGTYHPDKLSSLVGRGGANVLGFVVLIPSFWLLLNDQRSLNVKMILLSPFLLIVLLMGSRGSLIFLPIIFFIWLKDSGLSPLHKWGQLIIMVLIGLTLMYFLGGTGFLNIGGEINPIYLYKTNLSSKSSAGRIRALIYSWKIMKSSLARFFIGTGPGTYTSSGGYLSKAPLMLEMKTTLYPGEREEIIWHGEAGGTTDTTFSTIGVEYGFLGLILCEVTFMGFYLYTRSLRRQFLTAEDTFGVKLSSMMSYILFLLLLGQTVSFIWEKQYLMWPIWIMLGVLKRQHYIKIGHPNKEL